MVVDGKKIAESILLQIKKEIKKLPPKTLGAVLVGDDPASQSFITQKVKAAESIGVGFKTYRFGKIVKTAELVATVKKLGKSKEINGTIIQLPLPAHINVAKVLAAINPKKDIDALSRKPRIFSPVIEAVKFILNKYKINYKNKSILIVGRGRLVGKPVYRWLSTENRHVEIIDEKQKNKLSIFTKNTDIIISGVGYGSLIKGIMVKKGSILIDFGFDKSNGKIGGDFDFKSCAKKAKLITPVPGGTGPIMVAMLFRNLLALDKIGGK